MSAPELEPLKGYKLVLGTLAFALGSFMNVLDMSIANVALPTIAGDFAISPTQGTWVITSYAVSEAIFLPLTGFLAKRIGEVRQFIFATILFTIASMLCGLAPSFEVLVISRILQGIVGASMIPLSQTLIMKCYPPAKRGMALGIWATTTIVAPVLGPLIGGWLTDNLVWRWAFYINLPFGILIAVMVYWLYGAPKPESSKEKIDLIGIALLVAAVASMQIALDKGSELDWLSSSFVATLATISFISWVAFVLWELGAEHPIVDLRLFRLVNFRTSAICLGIGSFAFYIYIVIGPLWLQTQLGYTAFNSGKVMAITGVLALFCGPLFGANIHRIDARIIATIGFAAMAIGCWMAAGFTTGVDEKTLMFARLIMGVGIAGFFMPMSAISMSQLRGSQIASGTGISNFLRNVGASVGTAVATTLWQDNAIRQHENLMSNIQTGNLAYQQLMETTAKLGMTEMQRYALVDNLVTSQAYMLSTNQLMLLAGLILVALMPLIWLSKPPFGSGLIGH
ncbi:DHA2 family efflux MFS transporter permease subunit [Polynucleobacter sp. 78F-HAINBA]|jgi:DHA2 family multidrug resistance protein|uniref:DHA2 family efflux MFS transporter permease subunit n=1 Tax=unclassified Polynucleobacter TaxID=2640945 RepID=UPI001C0D8F7A|nr:MULTISPECIES: DHA2 family efflux MFS transporter permease subunit [unclassified Polynucleobacter]MBU3586304.1 DHA2 family efflux MFS transporter permease subunit [Polynucleobacter sp. 31A-FELB]MBU3591050.1 DHA2 family efflux MFS transporter permease subunit [Polynucleobacter sp. 78F-HAINBA]